MILNAFCRKIKNKWSVIVVWDKAYKGTRQRWEYIQNLKSVKSDESVESDDTLVGK